MGQYRNEIEQFIYEICYRPMWEVVNTYIFHHPTVLDLSYCRIKCPDSAILKDMLLEFPANISIDEDTLYFDAVISCTVEVSQNDYGNTRTAETAQWLRVSCEAIIEDTLKAFSVSLIRRYQKGQEANISDTAVKVSRNIVPRIYPDDLDKEAKNFLNDTVKKPWTSQWLFLLKNSI